MTLRCSSSVTTLDRPAGVVVRDVREARLNTEVYGRPFTDVVSLSVCKVLGSDGFDKVTARLFVVTETRPPGVATRFDDVTGDWSPKRGSGVRSTVTDVPSGIVRSRPSFACRTSVELRPFGEVTVRCWSLVGRSSTR